MTGKTLYDKIWDAHRVAEDANGETILYIDLHLIHEVTTPQAFAGLRAAGRPVRRPDRTLAVADHNVPTINQAAGTGAVADDEARLQLQTLERNVAEAGIEFFPMGDVRNGIVHVVGPEQGRSQPGMTIVCGDSHTSTPVPLGPWPTGLAPPRSSTSSPPRPCVSARPRICASGLTASLRPVLGPRTLPSP